jgi:hypothetical protein
MLQTLVSLQLQHFLAFPWPLKEKGVKKGSVNSDMLFTFLKGLSLENGIHRDRAPFSQFDVQRSKFPILAFKQGLV